MIRTENLMIRRIFIVFILAALLLSPVMAFNISGLERMKSLTDDRLTPFNPDFINYIRFHSIIDRYRNSNEGHSLGLIPTPFMLREVLVENTTTNAKGESVSDLSSNEVAKTGLADVASYRLAPTNPEFEHFIRNRTSQVSRVVDQEGHSLGLIPSVIDIGTLTSSEYGSSELVTSTGTGDSYSVSKGAMASSFDLRTTGKVPPIKDQAECGACWAFSTYGSLESTNLPETSWDFSENHMKNTHGFDLSPCQGGNYQMSTAYLARWGGAVSESADPYSASDSVSSMNEDVTVHVQDVTYLPKRTGPLDNDLIKQMLQQHGALYSQVRWESSYYARDHAAYYYPGSSSPNHAIVIVGWDDRYSRNNFATPPPGDGAFLIRNNWGDDWGDRGYGYVSYYDSWIGKPSAQYFSESVNNYDYVYQYDPLGWVISFGTGSDTGYLANVFSSSQDEELAAVGFFTAVPNSDYQIEVYRGVSSSPRGRTPSVVQTGSFPFAGYHTVDLTSTVPLERGEKFSIVMTIRTPGYNYPVAIEYPYNGYSTKARARAGESWVSKDGATWTDITTAYPNTNVCLKAFTRTMEGTSIPVPTRTPVVIPTTPTTSVDKKSPAVSITSPSIMARYSPGSEVTITWSSSDNVGVVSASLMYSVDRGKNWNMISQSVPPAGTYSWILPDGLSGSLVIKVSAKDAAGNAGSATKSISIKAGASTAGPVTSRPSSTVSSTGGGDPSVSAIPDSVRTAVAGRARFNSGGKSIAPISVTQRRS
jgi:C1A family cysteine protease